MDIPMQAHIVAAHPEPKSYNAHLAATAPVHSPFIRRRKMLDLG